VVVVAGTAAGGDKLGVAGDEDHGPDRVGAVAHLGNFYDESR
jgi:hypothetical protein